jgi:hypothetical protein
MRRLVDKAVAVTAIHSELSGMQRVTERDRLNRRITDARIFRRKVIPDSRADQVADDKKRQGNLEGKKIKGTRKYIRHLLAIYSSNRHCEVKQRVGFEKYKFR